MSYQSLDAGTKERFFTVVDRSTGLPITSGTVNYYLKAKSGDNAGKWWDDDSSAWVVSETGNPMTHEADGHWEVDLDSSPFQDGVRYLEYVKESSALHVPDSRHLIGQYKLTINSNGYVINSNESEAPDNDSIASILTIVTNCNSETVLDQVLSVLRNLEVRPERTVLGPCRRQTVSSNVYGPR